MTVGSSVHARRTNKVSAVLGEMIMINICACRPYGLVGSRDSICSRGAIPACSSGLSHTGIKCESDGYGKIERVNRGRVLDYDACSNRKKTVIKSAPFVAKNQRIRRARL